MFENYDPREGKILRILNHQGNIEQKNKNLPMMSDEKALKAYEVMVKTREADLWALSLNRQGRMPTFPPVEGQEANAVGAAMALNNDDWFVQAFRELGGLLIRGVPLSQTYLLWLGNEISNKFEIDKYHILPMVVPIASQLPHAVGIAYAEMYKATNRVTIAFVGDGGTSQGDFHESCNFAGVWKAPIIFYIQNNQWAISVPRKKQTASETLAQKAFSYGFEGLQVDGNDVFAVYTAIKMAAQKAREGKGPTLIEGITYRLGPHTTADDPSKYRTSQEVDEWRKKCPLLRMEKYLLGKKLITEDRIKTLKEESKEFAQSEFEKAENYPLPTMKEISSYTYKKMPAVLEKQITDRERLNTKIGNKF